jgi:DNA-binding GntR family transcriptional regulator
MSDMDKLYCSRIYAIKAQPIILNTDVLSSEYNPVLKNYDLDKLFQKIERSKL